MEKYVIGIDFGTLSGRGVLAKVSDGTVIASAQLDYPHAVMDRTLPTGEAIGKDWALQHPADYVAVLDAVLPQLTAAVNPADIIGVAIDCTGSTALPVDEEYTPLCFKPEWEHNPYAYTMMWKHHGCPEQAERMTAVARQRGEAWLDYYGGRINTEWYFPKLLQILEEAPELYHAMAHYIEAGEWIIYQLTGSYVRSESCLGCKVLYVNGQFPSDDYFAALNPDFRNVVHEKIRGNVQTIGTRAGRVTAQAAQRWGLKEGTAAAVFNLDAHACMPAAGIYEAGKMLAIIGTSTVHLSLGDTLKAVPGVCGSVYNSILPGYIGFECGQSAVGDSFHWLEKNAISGTVTEAARAAGLPTQVYLTQLAEKLRPGESGLLALDWFNGNRTILVDSDLTGMILGMTLQTRPEEIYRALIESTAYGTRIIIENYREHGVPVDEFYASGGISQKNAMAMQIYADVLNMPIHIVDAAQGPALGSAIFASVAAGAAEGGWDDVPQAIRSMGSPVARTFYPNAEHAAIYDKLYAEYKTLHDYFGRGENDVMKRLKQLR